MTAQVSMCRVIVALGSGAALMPMPVLGLAVPWMVRLRRVISPEVMVMASPPADGEMTATFLPTIVSGEDTAIVGVAWAKLPLTITTGFEPDFAMLTPF